MEKRIARVAFYGAFFVSTFYIFTHFYSFTRDSFLCFFYRINFFVFFFESR